MIQNITKFNDGIERYILLSRLQIDDKVRELGIQISTDYKGSDIVIIGILKGSFIFLADLIRALDPNLNLSVDFTTVSSYSGMQRSGKPVISQDIRTDINNKNVLVVEDIVDSGHSINSVMDYLNNKNPKSIKICTLLSKPSKREVKVKIDYLGFEIDDKWVEGYGLDTDGKYRNLPDIWCRN